MERYVGGYVDRADVMHLFFRGKDGGLYERSAEARWSSFFKMNEIAPYRTELERTIQVKGTEQEGDWLRVDWASRDVRWSILATMDDQGKPIQNWFQANGITIHEADVHPIRKFFVDNDADVESNPRIAFLDIETDSRLPFSQKEQMRVLVATVIAGCEIPEKGIKPGDLVCRLVLEEFTDEAEAELLEELFDLLASFDVIAAWYGDGFDFPVLKARALHCKVDVNFEFWRLLDHLRVFELLNSHVAESGAEKQSLALNVVAFALLGEGKHDFDASKTYQAWEAGGAEREEMVDYCVQDTRLLFKIEQKTGYLSLFGTICGACKLFMETSSIKSTRQMDGFMLKLGKGLDYHFPSRFGEPVTGSKYAGAYVLHPEVCGIEHDIHVADFASLYPSIIISWNMSPETLLPDAPIEGPIPFGVCRCPTTGVSFTTKKEGMLPIALKELIALRKKWNDKKASLPPGTPEWVDADRWSMAYKVLANSFYGVMGSPFSRYYDRYIAESVTQNGAWLIRNTIRAANEAGFTTIYGDTDSIFVKKEGMGSAIGEEGFNQFTAFVDECNRELYPRLLEEQGCTVNRIKLAYEKAFSSLVMCAAKKYCGTYVHYKGSPATADSKPEIKGLEYKRGDTVKLARELQAQIITLFTSGCEDWVKYDEVVATFKERVLYQPLELDDVAVAQSLTRRIAGYVAKTPPAHVRVAKMLKERGEDVSVGVKVAYFVTDGSVSPAQVSPVSDWEGECDRFALWEKRVYPPTRRFVEAAFPEQADHWKSHAKVRPKKPRIKKAINASIESLLALMEPVAPRMPGQSPNVVAQRPQGGVHKALPSPTPLPNTLIVLAVDLLAAKETTMADIPTATRVAVVLDAKGMSPESRKIRRIIVRLGDLLEQQEDGQTSVTLEMRLDEGTVHMILGKKVQLSRKLIPNIRKIMGSHGSARLRHNSSGGNDA